MYAASRHGTPSFRRTADLAVFWLFIWKFAHPVSDRTQPCLTSVKLVVLAGPLGHSPRKCGMRFVLFVFEKCGYIYIYIPFLGCIYISVGIYNITFVIFFPFFLLYYNHCILAVYM